MDRESVIIKPILSEKSNLLREGKTKKYVFSVDKRANKHEIKEAIEKVFGVTCTACNVINVKGKPKFSRGKGGYIKGKTPSWKKAIVTLQEGQSIQQIDGVV